jgi:hypothetical protein
MRVCASAPAGPGVMEWFNVVMPPMPSEAILTAVVTSAHGQVLSDNLIPLTPPSQMELHKARVTYTVGKLSATGSVPITLTTDVVAVYVTLTTQANGRFSDNAFLLLPSAPTSPRTDTNAPPLPWDLGADTSRRTHPVAFAPSHPMGPHPSHPTGPHTPSHSLPRTCAGPLTRDGPALVEATPVQDGRLSAVRSARGAEAHRLAARRGRLRVHVMRRGSRSGAAIGGLVDMEWKFGYPWLRCAAPVHGHWPARVGVPAQMVRPALRRVSIAPTQIGNQT